MASVSHQALMMATGSGTGSGGISCPTSATFLARTSGLDATHTAAYNNLICGLVSDGIWTKFDVLHIYATQDTTTAQLNLVSTSYPATLNGAPSFAADRGYTGTSGSAIKYIDTGFNATTAASPNFIQNAAHVSAWSVIDAGADDHAIIGAFNNLGQGTFLAPKLVSGDSLYRINSQGVGGVANATPTGHYLANRSGDSGVNTSQGYKNATSVITDGTGSFATQNLNFLTLGGNNQGTPAGNPSQVAMISIGGSLTAGEVTLFYNRLRTYMTAVGVP